MSSSPFFLVAPIFGGSPPVLPPLPPWPRPEELRLGGRLGEGGEALLAPRGAQPMGPRRRGPELAAGEGWGTPHRGRPLGPMWTG